MIEPIAISPPPTSTSGESHEPSVQPTVVIAGLALGYNEGGLRSYINQLACGLGRARPFWTVRVLVPENAPLGDLPSAAIVEVVPRRLAHARALVSQIATGLRIGSLAARQWPEAVFITPTDFWSLAAPARRIAVTHDLIPEIDVISRGSRLRQMNRRLSIRYARRATRWLSVSNCAAADIGRVLGRGRQPLAMPNWVDDRFRVPASAAAVQELRTRLGLPERFYLYVGGYRKYKNVELLIRAHAAAARHADVPPLVLSGIVPTNLTMTSGCDVYGEIQRSGSRRGTVLTPGHVASADLPTLYAAASLFVSPSLHEGFGYPPVEAMAMGCPVLVADRTAFREVVPFAGSRFDPDDEPQLVRKLLAGAVNPEAFRCPFPSIYTAGIGAERFAQCVEDVVRNARSVPVGGRL